MKLFYTISLFLFSIQFSFAQVDGPQKRYYESGKLKYKRQVQTGYYAFFYTYSFSSSITKQIK
jgi:antitoxin component YwqK of YwqJK toxin-antitoxin module